MEERNFEELSQDLKNLVGFGLKIIEWDHAKTKGKYEDSPVIFFLRNLIEEIDAISILVKYGCADSSKNLLRTALENLFYLDYLLESNTKMRSISYLVWNTLNNNKVLARLIENSNEYKDLSKKFEKDKLLKGMTPPIVEEAVDLIKLGLKILEQPDFKLVKDEYDSVKAKIKRNPNWYSLFDGPLSLEQLANQINRGGTYEILYRNWSHCVHGTDIMQGKQSEGEIKFRNSKVIIDITLHCFNICSDIFKLYVEKRIPERMVELCEWHESSVKQPFIDLNNRAQLNVENI